MVQEAEASGDEDPEGEEVGATQMDVVEDGDEGEEDLPMNTQVVEESEGEGSEEENNEDA